MNYKAFVNQATIFHVIASINENVGGVAYSVTQLATSLAKLGINENIFTLDYQKHGLQVPTIKVNLHTYRADYIAQYFRGFNLNLSRSLFQATSNQLDLIHNHGLWMFPNLYARIAATKNKVPLVISPHGMLEPWSLKNSWYKKALVWLLYEKENLLSASVFHATSLEEVNSIRRLGFKQPIALIPHGINLPQLSQEPTREILNRAFPALANKKWLLFLSRIHPKKGLENLLYVWQTIARKFPEWHLIIAGPDLNSYQSNLEQLTANLNLTNQVTFTGMLSGQLKTSALKNADLFVLPTHSENFGIAIAESLAYCVPVVTTKQAPWQDLIKHNCGWWIEDNQPALMAALMEAMQLSDQERQAMGIQGRYLIETHYSWDLIAQEMSKVYYWILYGGTPPSCLHF